MSILVCNDCGNDMGNVNLGNCTVCGSRNLSRILGLSDKISVGESIKGKSNKMPGKKKPSSEFQAGDEWSVSKEKFVDKARQIDREHNSYFERVFDKESGEIIHECHELLDEHFGHGSAKFRQEENNDMTTDDCIELL